MKRQDLESGLVVAARDYDHKFEKAEVLEVGGNRAVDSDTHLVKFLTGSYRGKTRELVSREIKPWNAYEPAWNQLRKKELQIEVAKAQIRYDHDNVVESLEAVQMLLSSVGIDCSLGQVLIGSDGIMERKEALIFVSTEAMKLKPLISTAAYSGLVAKI